MDRKRVAGGVAASRSPGAVRIIIGVEDGYCTVAVYGKQAKNREKIYIYCIHIYILSIIYQVYTFAEMAAGDAEG